MVAKMKDYWAISEQQYLLEDLSECFKDILIGMSILNRIHLNYIK